MQHTNLTNTQAERRQKSLARGLLLMTVVGAMAIPLIPAVSAQTEGEIEITHVADPETWTLTGSPAGWNCVDNNDSNDPVVTNEDLVGPNPSVTCTPPSTNDDECEVVTVAAVGVDADLSMEATSECSPGVSANTAFPGGGQANGNVAAPWDLTCEVNGEDDELDWGVGCGVGAAESVPTLSQWGIVGMVAALGGIGVLAISRRRK